MCILRCNFLIMIILSSLYATSQELTPPIQNFSIIDYAAASQNWDITLDEAGIIYAANNEGLLTYDGLKWELYPLKNNSIIRSVFAHKDRIYTGSYKEFGFWSRNNKGDLGYTSLMPLLGSYTLQSEEFWEILDFRDAIYFRSFGAIYKYANERIEPVIEVVSNKMLVYNDRLLIAKSRDGLYYLEENGELVPLPNQGSLRDQTIVDIEVDGKNLLVGTRDALYVFDGERCVKFADDGLNSLLERFELNHILKISEEEVVFATVKNGIIHYNKESGKIKMFNRNSGLQNNTVLGLARGNAKVWLSLDNGIDAIQLNSAVEFYTDDSGELGAVYDLSFFTSSVHLASNTGVYYLDNSKLHIVEGAEGHSWNLAAVHGTLYSNHNTGTYKIQNNRFIPVETRTGSFDILDRAGGNNEFYIGNYTGISIFSPETNQLTALQEVNIPVKKMLIEKPGVMWAEHPYEGIYRIGLDEDSDDVSFIQKVNGNRKESNVKATMYKINNQIAILEQGRWYRYNPILDSLEIFRELKDYANHRLLLEDTGGFWFLNNVSNSIVYTDFRDVKINLTFRELNNRLVKGHERMVKSNDSTFYITLNDGYARINLKELVRSKEREIISEPIIQGIADANGWYDLSSAPKLPYKAAREVKVKVALPDSDASGLGFVLEGNTGQKGIVEQGILNFQNLGHGNYRLKLFTISPQESSSKTVTLAFSVDPPWYLSNLMKVVYVLIVLGVIGLIYWYNRSKLKKHRKVLEQKFEKEHQERLNMLEKAKLMNEIDSKRKELANTTMMAAKKNEVLLEIQGELSKDKDKFSNQFRLKHLINKINQAIKNKDEWKVFETNFNELHEDFFRELLEKYPNLSNKDLKLCAYLKMNLSSKEIAPLMGITVRGVEVHRYRLRKKMGMDSSANLTQFLIKHF